MNCQDVSGILDDGDSRGLSAAERRALDAHLAGCTECRAALRAHEAMGGMVVPAMGAELAERCRQLVVAKAADPARRAGGRPFFVIGLLLAGAAAASFLGLNVIGGSGGGPEPPEVAVSAPATSADANAATAMTSPAAGTAIAGPGEPAGVAPSSTEFTVGVAPLRQLSTNPQVIQVSETVYRAFLDELRKIPNLELVMLAPGEFEENDFRAGIAWWMEGAETGVSPPVQAPPSGVVVVAGEEVELSAVPTALRNRIEAVTGSASSAVNGENTSGVVNVILDENVEGIRVDLSYVTTDEGHGATLPPDPLPYNYLIAVTSTNPGPGSPWQFMVSGLSRGGLTFSAAVGTSTSGPLVAVDFLAPVIAGLQEQLLPVDEATLAAIEQAVLDTRLPPVDRMREFGRLKRMSERAGRADLSDDVALAGVGLLMGVDRDWERQALLTSLVGVDNEVVVQPLSHILRNDADEATRLQAALALTAFEQDPHARAALETAASVDPSAAVRQNARWGLLDAVGRRNLVVASLLDTRLGDAERLEPLLFELDWVNEPPVELGSAVDATVVNELTALLRREERAGTRANIVGRFAGESSPALTPMFIERLAEDDSEIVRRAAVNALSRRRDEPGVSYALGRAAVQDPSPGIRRMLARDSEIQN